MSQTVGGSNVHDKTTISGIGTRTRTEEWRTSVRACGKRIKLELQMKEIDSVPNPKKYHNPQSPSWQKAIYVTSIELQNVGREEAFCSDLPGWVIPSGWCKRGSFIVHDGTA